MDNKNQVIIIGLCALIAGLLIGYFLGANTRPYHGMTYNKPMYEEMQEHMYDDDIVASDGELQHMMDEMMLIGRGQSGEAYERAWLRGMVVHHLGAVNMAEELLRQTERPELIELGNTIIETQSAEIEQMKEWLDMWFSKN